MSNTVTTPDGIEVYESQILAALDEFMSEQNIEDMRRTSQNIWTAALIFISRRVFSDKAKLKREPYDYKSGNLTSNNNAFDLTLLNEICDSYIYLCYLFDKEISISGYCKLIGIPQSYVYAWGGNTGYAPNMQTNREGQEIYKKLTENNEDSLSNMLISGGSRTPVALLGALNHRHNWALPNTSGETPKDTPDEIARDIESRHISMDVEKPQLPDGL